MQTNVEQHRRRAHGAFQTLCLPVISSAPRVPVFHNRVKSDAEQVRVYTNAGASYENGEILRVFGSGVLWRELPSIRVRLAGTTGFTGPELSPNILIS